MTQNKIYFVLLESLEEVHAQYVPLAADGNRQAKYAEVQPAGMNNPSFHYVGGSEDLKMSVSFTTENETRSDVKEKVNKFRSLCNADGKEAPPEKIKIVFGGMFDKSKWLLKSVAYKYELFNDEFNFSPDMAKIDLVFSMAPDNSTRK
jgi:hypothetical protein